MLFPNHLRLPYSITKSFALLLAFHKARHNFGTHMTLSLGVPLETVSKMMGHTNVMTTQIYAQVTDKKVDEDMKRLKEVTAGQKINIYEEDLSNLPKRRRKAASV